MVITHNGYTVNLNPQNITITLLYNSTLYSYTPLKTIETLTELKALLNSPIITDKEIFITISDTIG